MTRRALVIGEALVDVVHRHGTSTALPGGSCANVAVALARLDRPTMLATRFGDDGYGDLLDVHLSGSGVTLAAGSRRPGERTSTAEALLGPDGSATYRFDVRWDLSPELPEGDFLVAHTGSIAAQLEPGAQSVEALLGAVRTTATVSYDLNARPDLFGEPARAGERVARLVALSDVCKASDEDLAWLHPDRSADEVAAAWLRTGPAAVLVTRGGQGSTVHTRSGRVDVAPARVSVVDTIGAGDTFCAAVVDGLWSLGLLGAERRDRLHALGTDGWHAVARYAAEVAGIVVTRPGADPPYRSELPAGLSPTASS